MSSQPTIILRPSARSIICNYYETEMLLHQYFTKVLVGHEVSLETLPSAHCTTLLSSQEKGSENYRELTGVEKVDLIL